MGHTSKNCSLIDWTTWKLEIIFLNFCSKDKRFFRCKKNSYMIRTNQKKNWAKKVPFGTFYLQYTLRQTLNALEKILNNVPISIHIYRNGILLSNTMSKFIRSKYLHNLQNKNQTKVSATEFLSIDVNDILYKK